MLRSGTSPTSWRDLADDGASVHHRGRSQRFACRCCGHAVSVPPVPIVGFARITPRLADAVRDGLLGETSVSLAQRLRIQEIIVRKIFAQEARATLEATGANGADVILTRSVSAGDRRFAFAHDALDGRLVDAYENVLDPRLAERLRRTSGVVHSDYRLAEGVKRLLPPEAVLSIHRASVADALGRLMPACVRSLLGHLDGETRAEARRLAKPLARTRYQISREDAEAVSLLAATSLAVTAFVEARDELLSVWSTPDPGKARRSLGRWVAGLGPVLLQVFAKAITWIEAWSPSILNEGYGALSMRAWHQAHDVRPSTMPHDPPIKTIVRTLVHSALPNAALGRPLSHARSTAIIDPTRQEAHHDEPAGPRSTAAHPRAGM